MFYELLLTFVYLPVCWASLAAFSMATCCKASCRVACDDGRPNEDRTCLAESCMLWKIVARKISGSILYFVYEFIYKL